MTGDEQTRAAALKNPVHSKIYSMLGVGEGRAVPLKQLVTWTGYPERELRGVIEKMRRRGILVCASRKGYYRPSSDEELSRWVKQEKRRARSILRTIRAAGRVLKDAQEQNEEEKHDV